MGNLFGKTRDEYMINVLAKLTIEPLFFENFDNVAMDTINKKYNINDESKHYAHIIERCKLNDELFHYDTTAQGYISVPWLISQFRINPMCSKCHRILPTNYLPTVMKINNFLPYTKENTVIICCICD